MAESQYSSGCSKETSPILYLVLFIVANLLVGLSIYGGIRLLSLLQRGSSNGLWSILRYMGWTVEGFVFGHAGLLVVSLALKRKLLPFSIGTVSRYNVLLLPVIQLLARLIKMDESRLGQSFIVVHNRLVRSWREHSPGKKLLVLLPHCLERGVRKKIDERVSRYDCLIRVVSGGNQAREAVAETRPDSILAVACERDLVSGIMELSGRIPSILAVPNIQRHGPCRATDINLHEFGAALDFLWSILPRENRA